MRQEKLRHHSPLDNGMVKGHRASLRHTIIRRSSCNDEGYRNGAAHQHHDAWGDRHCFVFCVLCFVFGFVELLGHGVVGGWVGTNHHNTLRNDWRQFNSNDMDKPLKI